MSNTPSDAYIDALAQQHLKAFAQFTGAGEVWFEGEVDFARAIEAEVRKQDDALIQQMLESMCWAAMVMAISEDEAPGYFAAITAARARLGEKT